MYRDLHTLILMRVAEPSTGRAMTVVPELRGWVFVQRQGPRPSSLRMLQTLEQRVYRHLRAPRAWAARALLIQGRGGDRMWSEEAGRSMPAKAENITLDFYACIHLV